jgi:diguanylate cyclase (GGDEF)-like protein/PAS domain S-box-containing protein
VTTRLRVATWLALGAVVVIHLLKPTGVVGNATFLTAVWAASGAAWLGARRAPSGSRLIPVLVAVGLTASALGDLAYFFYTWTGTEPNVSLADIPWYASYLGLGAALFITLVRAHERERIKGDAVIDALTIVTMSLLLFWELSVRAIISDTTVSLFVRSVWAGYPIADAILVALVLRALASRQSRALMGFGFAFGAACWLAADLAYLLLAASGIFTRLLDVGWMVGVLLMAQAAWRRPARAAVKLEADDVDSGHGFGKVAIAIVPLTVPFAMGLVDRLMGRPADQLEAFVAMALVLTLTFVRMVRLLGSEQRARASARKSDRHHARLAANSSDAVIVVDLEGRLLNESPSLAALVGFEGPTVGIDWMLLLKPVDIDGLRALFALVTQTQAEVFDTEVQVQHAGGSEVWLSARIVNLVDDADVEGVIVALQDISDRKRAERELVHQAFHDVLTGLPNRALYRDRVEQALRRNGRTGLDPAVLYLDLDGFKNVNDSLGHDAGDELLRAVSQRLLDAVRSDDTVARLGGDEFAILIEQSPRPVDEATAIADRVLQALTAPFEISGSAIRMSASIGIAAGDGRSSAAALLRNADIAMYQAKASGKSQWITYEPRMRAAALEGLQLEADLDAALGRDEFRLVYQPVVKLETQQIVGFEALLRWHHPTLGVIAPDKFIPLAEESGSIVPIGQWVLRTACAVGARWQRDYPLHPKLTMAVNLSARQLAADNLVLQVAEALAESGLEPTSLVLEMTETVLIKDASLAARRLHELRRTGVRLAIDDFGTGYSSLSYLRQFPVDILKIDRSFINTITDRKRIPAIVRGLLDLGRTLDLETIAEGVEDDVQRDGLRDEHCQFAQGFLFAKPLCAADAEAMLAQMTSDADATKISNSALAASPGDFRLLA